MTSALPQRPLSRTVVAAILVQIAISAGTHLAAKHATQFLEPLLLITLRLLSSGIAFALILAVTPGPTFPPKTHRKWLLLYGLLTGPINQGLFMYGLARSKATHGGLLYALTPIGVYVLAVALRREELNARRLLGIVVAFSGVTVLLLGHGLAEAMGPLVGDLFILGAVGAWVVWTTESRPFAAAHGGLRTAGWSLISGALWMIPFAPFAVTRDALSIIPASAWWCLAYLVLATSVVSYVLWNYALARAEASRVAIFSNLQPVTTAVAAWAILDEPLGWEVAVGGGLVLLGVRIAQR